MALRRAYRITLALVALLSTAACVPQNTAPKAASAARRVLPEFESMVSSLLWTRSNRKLTFY